MPGKLKNTSPLHRISQRNITEKQNEVKKKLGGSRQFWVQLHNTVPADPIAHCYPNGNFVSSPPQPLLPLGYTFPTPIFCGFSKSADQKINLYTKSPHWICFQEVQEVTWAGTKRWDYWWLEGKGPEEEQISMLSSSQTLCTLTCSWTPSPSRSKPLLIDSWRNVHR